MSSVNRAFDTWFKIREVQSDAPLRIPPGVKIAIKTSRNAATAAQDELETLKDKLEASNLANNHLNYGRHEAFKKKVATSINQLDAIIRHTDLMLERVKRAEQEKSESLKSNEYGSNNNNNNNNVQ